MRVLSSGRRLEKDGHSQVEGTPGAALINDRLTSLRVNVGDGLLASVVQVKSHSFDQVVLHSLDSGIGGFDVHAPLVLAVAHLLVGVSNLELYGHLVRIFIITIPFHIFGWLGIHETLELLLHFLFDVALDMVGVTRRHSLINLTRVLLQDEGTDTRTAKDMLALQLSERICNLSATYLADLLSLGHSWLLAPVLELLQIGIDSNRCSSLRTEEVLASTHSFHCLSSLFHPPHFQGRGRLSSVHPSFVSVIRGLPAIHEFLALACDLRTPESTFHLSLLLIQMFK